MSPGQGGGDELERGIGLFGKALGSAQADSLRRHIASAEFGKEIGTWAAEFVFGKVWARPGLDRRMRSCAALGMLIALRQPDEIKYLVRMALESGVTVREIEEILYTAIPYAGFPAASTAKQAMIAALREIEAEKAQATGRSTPPPSA
jgi:4-carboxymuconolactone decarboxylase